MKANNEYGKRFKNLPIQTRREAMWCKHCATNLNTNFIMITNKSYSVECTVCETDWNIKFPYE